VKLAIGYESLPWAMTTERSFHKPIPSGRPVAEDDIAAAVEFKDGFIKLHSLF
jgi:hypothetical protein